MATIAAMQRRLTEAGVTHTLDSGTLLGIIRDGRPIAGDNDIDLAVVADERTDAAAAVEQIAAVLRRDGYRVQLRSYRGLPYKIKATPTLRSAGDDRQASLYVDIIIYRKAGEYLWCPQWLDIPHGPHGRGAGWIVRRAIYELLKRRKRADTASRLWHAVSRNGTFWIPAGLLASMRSTEEGFQVPERTEEYLEFRYGEWRTPDPAWRIDRDGALQLAAPEQLGVRFDEP